MARLEGETSNELAKILEEWNTYLENDVPYYQDNKPEGLEL